MALRYIPRTFGGAIVLSGALLPHQQFTTMAVCRGSGPLWKQKVIERSVVCQIDQQSLDMMQFDKGASPFDLFTIFAWAALPILRNDHLIDENTRIVYTVSSRVETFPNGKSEFTALVPVGS